jgi:hypothetical protein
MARRLGRLFLPPLLALLLLLSPGAGAAGGLLVHVTPAAGGPATRFVASYSAPVKTGVVGSIRLRDEVSAETSSASSGCQSSVSKFVPAVRRGQRVQVALAVGRWCVGVFKGKLLELQTPVCPPGSMCPMYVRIRTLATFSFRVTTVPAPGTLSGVTQISYGCPGPQREGDPCEQWSSFPNALFQLTSLDGAAARTITSDSNGSFTLGLPAGRYRLTPLPQPHTTGGTPLTAIVQAGGTTSVSVRFEGFPRMV